MASFIPLQPPLVCQRCILLFERSPNRIYSSAKLVSATRKALERSAEIEELIRLAHDVIVSHGYIEESDSRDVKIEKLARLDQRPSCLVLSCHKNWLVLDDLRNRTAMRRAYYARDRRNAPILRDFSRRLREIFAMYPLLVATNASEPPRVRVFT